MKKISTFLILSCVAFLVGGCLVIRTGKKCPPQSGSAVVFPGDQDPVIEEINAVGRLRMESGRVNFYTQIASRKGTSEQAQITLVKAAFRNLRMESSKVHLLLTLIANPDFTGGAKSEILRDLNKLRMESSKAIVLDTMGKRGQLKPPVVTKPPVVVLEDTPAYAEEARAVSESQKK